jgi:uncharacterized protein YbaR (Trm112 family)
LVCAIADCRRAFPVLDDIPVLLVVVARFLSPDAPAATPR